MGEASIGDRIRVSTDPGFSLDGDPVDPAVVRLRWRVAGAEPTVWEYDVDPEVVRDNVGVYHADIPATRDGVYYYRWEGEGIAAAAEESAFYVHPTQFPST